MDNPPILDPPTAPQPEKQGPNKFSRSKTSPIDSETIGSSGRSNGRSSIDSSSDRPKSQAGETSDSAKAGSSGFSKLLASRRKKKKKDEQKQMDELPTQFEIAKDGDTQENRLTASRDGASSVNDNRDPPKAEVVHLLTNDSEPDRGFYTNSSPLIHTTSVDTANDTDGVQADVESARSGPSATHSISESNPDTEFSIPNPQPTSTLNVPTDHNGKKRGISPGRRFRNAFSSNQDKKKDPNRDRASSTTSGESKKGTIPFSSRGRKSSVSSKKDPSAITEPPPPLPPPIRTDLQVEKSSERSDAADPKTPPHTALAAPQTTVTPPSPHVEQPIFFTSPDSLKSKDSMQSEIVVSPSGNMISHRRVRSASSASHKPSKLSNSISALGPTIEETKAASRDQSTAQQGGFFSSVFSAAQNAASSLSNSLNSQSKPRSLPQPEPTESQTSLRKDGDNIKDSDGSNKSDDSKPSAIDTLGSGDLDFSHLDIAIPPGGSVSTPDGVVITKPDMPPEKHRSNTVYERDDQAARLEHRRALRAVTMAYEKPSDISIVPPSDDSLELQSSASLSRDPGDHTPPSGSILEGETNTRPYRSGSVRSRLARRRHRGSSGATTSTVGAIGASSLALGAVGANSSMPRLTGFAVASKKRNRDFHQLFRSVPEDDYLIEDYSCALQREIILAGRIYISEGHICFSSNILGWVTTLVISFDEIVAIEKESTAMVFPNAIAIQTLHARHTFRSLLSRESTYDLMVNIWKINHPTLKSSVNGTRVTEGTGDKTEKAGESDAESDDEDEIYDEDEEGDLADSFFEPGEGSVNGSERSIPMKSPSRQASGLLNANGAVSTAVTSNGESKGGKSLSGGDGDADFPGSATHPPTEYTDPSGQYDKVIKDEVIPAPLGKVYSYVFGPASVTFIPKFLVDNQKSGDLQFETEKGGLTNESKTRSYSYIKPLPGSIGPKQTKCISTESLDFFELDKAVLVTLSTQTPDVPSGNLFCTKTKYLFTWAANNQTRFLMTCSIEWSGKSWLKGPIEKGAIDGQTTFGNELINALKAAVARRTTARPGGKGKGRRTKTDMAAEEAAAAAVRAANDAKAREAQSWGFLEPLHQLFGPISDILKPLWSGNIAFLIIATLLLMLFFRSPSRPPVMSHDIGCPGYTLPQRLAAYEEMWRREESELWSWLEDRVGMDGMSFPTVNKPVESQMREQSRWLPGDRQFIDKLSENKMSDREMDYAIRTTRERLDTLERILTRRKSQSAAKQEMEHTEL
ncbi:hypothetical protein EYZ11_007376 [Aspergillus tanneri]|uniref:VASt domain-containing protein n=1 Tax=Aspergillus tanneri TaxID=1220188 RepID=A0A4S3JD34_9EURO|nr:hypothetical protein EYZ11_007376 [Aspergillus tanneri]